MLNKGDSNDKYQKSFNSMKDFKSLVETPETKPLVLISNDGYIHYCNQTFSHLFLLNETDNINTLQTEPNIEYFIRSLSKSQYSSFHFEVFFTSANFDLGNNYYVDVDRVLVNDEELMVLIFTSNTERRKIEDRINNLHNALEYGNVPVVITDDVGIINYSSRSFDYLLNSSIEFIYNRFLPDIFKEFLNKEELVSLKSAIQNKTEWTKLITFDGEFGKKLYKEIHLNPIVKTYSDSVNFIVTVNDITNYIQKNQIIQRSSERQQLIIDNISDPVLIIKDEAGVKIFVNANETFLSEFGFIKETLVESKLNDFATLPLFAQLIEGIKELDDSKLNLIKFDYFDPKLNKNYLTKISYADEVYNKTRLYIANYTDLTEQLKVQEQLRIAYEKEIQVSRLKSTFLANMSHEFRTPLNAIVGYSELLEDDLKNKEYDSLEDYTTFLKEGVQRLVKLVDNILEISILESGSDDFDFEKTSVNYIVRNMFNLYLPKTVEKSLTFELDLDDSEPHIFVDESKLAKIIDSLLDNALKYNVTNGMVMLRTEVSNNEVTIEVCDSGIGISLEKLEKILRPFEQVDDLGHTRSYEGAVLGLTIAHRLTHRLGGKFNITSEANEGTTVALVFAALN